MNSFAARLLAWYDAHGRHDLPWQQPRSAYRVWLAEVMLQQTQVATVLRYFPRFVAALPTLADLARADEDTVLGLWSGLGYYRRAGHLQAAARLCMTQHHGSLPADFAALAALPGIGRSTAGAILAQAHGQRWPILDGNVKRVLARFHGIEGWPGEAATQAKLWALAGEHTPAARVADYTQAIMDLGAMVCTPRQPQCTACPLARDCVAYRSGRTVELPAHRTAAAKPLRQVAMLLLFDRAGRVLLERRPATGVWPGLWSLPEAVPGEATPALAARVRARHVQALRLPAFRHVFTHFRLEVQPLLVRGVEPVCRVQDDPARRWCAPSEWLHLGLPAPVRRLLVSLAEGAIIADA